MTRTFSLSVEISKVNDEEWSIIHTHKHGFMEKIVLDSEEVRELIEEFKEEGF